MFLLSQPLTKAALQFGPSDLFAVTFMGLSILTCLDSDHILTCIISGLLGLLLACVGQDKMYAVQRLTFGSRNLLAGIDMIPVLIGLFAVTEVFKQTDPKKKRLSAEDGVSGGKVNTKMPSLKELWSIKWTMIRCSVVGTVVGILPGAGATIASFMCYTMETKISKYPEKFGTGIIDGIAASETANNAATGGAMVPLLSLGIPGGNAAAVMMSALTLKGVQLGPLLLVGLGGVFVELLRDVSLELAPLSPEGARAMIGRLKAAKLLTGFRGRPASDVEALSDVLVRVAAMCCALGDRLVSLDLNPVMVLPEGEGVRIVDIVMQVAPARHCGETD